MRVLTKSLVEQGFFFFCLVDNLIYVNFVQYQIINVIIISLALILSDAFVPERDGMCHKF